MGKRLIIAVMSSAAFLSGTAFSDCCPDLYVGADVTANRVHFEQMDNPVPSSLKFANVGGTFFFGARFTENVGMETGYGILGKWRSHQINYSSESKSKIRTNHGYVDLIGYLPISECPADLIGAVGIGYIDTKIRHHEVHLVDGVSILKTKLHMVGPRLGIGAQYIFGSNIGVRAMCNYQHVKKHEVKHIITHKVGVFYKF